MDAVKEIFGAVLVVAGLLGGGTKALKEIHYVVRKAALEKVSHGLPSLTEMNRRLGVSQK